MARRNAQARSAEPTAESTEYSNSSSHTFLIAAGAVRDGSNWQSDTVFSSEVITRLFASMEWWQGQIDMCQLAIETLQDRLTDYSKLLSDHMIAKRREQEDITRSMIDCTKSQLNDYKEWENLCIGQMKKIGMRRGARSGGMPLG
jgi:hypothetical protein